MQSLQKRLVLGTALAILAVAACNNSTPPVSETNDPTPTQTSKATEKTISQKGPELGTFGIQTADMNPNINPGDDFFEYVGGKWMDTFELPADRSSYGSFTVLAERSEKRVRAIIEDSASGNPTSGSIEQKIGDFFASYIDTDAINANGLTPIADDLAFLAGLATKEDVATAFARPDIRAASPIAPFVNVDAKRPDQYTVYLTQSGLGMPNRNYYLDEKFADKKELYKSFIAQMLSLAEIDNAAEKAQDIYALEERIAQAHWTPAKRRNRDITYNLKSRDELKSFTPEMPWDEMLEAAGLGAEQEFILREDDAIQNISKIFAETPINVWSDYLQFHLLRNNASILPSTFDEASFAFYGTALRGTPQQRERWKRGVSSVNGAMGEAVGKVYVERHFPEDSKAQMDELVKNLRIALDERLDTLPWMSEATIAAAHEKLNKFTPKIGYPEKWTDYSALEVVRGDAYGNAKRSGIFAWNESISRLGGPIDKTEWGMNPQRVNAYYSPTRNEIVSLLPFYRLHSLIRMQTRQSIMVVSAP